MKEKLRDLVDYYRELAQRGDIKISDVLDDLEKLLEEFPDPKPSKFFEFWQNNSGGRFYFDHDAGLSKYVIIEAVNHQMANALAESIGIYFDGCDKDMDCSCCGDRWDRAYKGGDSVPSSYGDPISLRSTPEYGKDCKDGPDGYIPYLDGRVVPFW